MPATLNDDKLWWDRQRKLNGICEEVLAATAAGEHVLLVAHFEATLAEIETALRARNSEVERLAHIDSVTVCSASAAKVWSALARSLPSRAPSVNDWGAHKLHRTSAAVSNPLNIMVAEHYPLRSRDEQLITATSALVCEARLTFHLSVDDPLLANFGVRQIHDLGKRLGIDEQTFLSHPLITRAIHQGQEKIERKVPRDLPAWSIEDWFKHNLPAK
jgi:hypothetical protein